MDVNDAGFNDCMQAALDGRPGATYVDIPSNILMAPAQGPLPSVPQSVPRPFEHRQPADKGDVQQAVSLLQGAQRWGPRLHALLLFR